MEIHLLRHPKPNVSKGICYGQTDLSLSWPITNVNIDFIKAQHYDYIYTSSLQRCTHLADLFDQPYIIDERLMEVNFGDWEMKYWNEIPEVDIAPWYADYITYRPPNGESFTDLISRIQAFSKEHLCNKSTKKILIITHLGVIRSFAHMYLQADLNMVFNLDVPYGEMLKLKVLG